MRGTQLWVALCILALPSASGAQAPAVSLHWEPEEGVEGCPEGAAVLQSIEAALPDALNTSESVVVHAHITPAEGGLRLELWAQRGPHAGRRELEAESCGPLAEAVTLIVTLLVAPETSLVPVDATPPEPPEDADRDTTASLAVNPYLIQQITSYDSGWIAGDDQVLPNPFRPTPRVRRHALVPGLGIEMGLAVGQLPDPTAYFGLRTELCVDDVCPFVGAGVLLPRAAPVPGVTGGEVEFGLSMARFGVRHRFIGDGWEVGPTLSIDVGAMRAESRNVTVPDSARTAWVSMTAGGSVGGGNSRFGARLDVAMQVPFTRPDFVLGGVGSVFSTSPVSLLTSLILELRIE